MNCGERIKTARLNAGLTQKQLGEACGIAEPTIRRYELGKLNPKFETLERIADALNSSVAFLLGINSVPTEEGELTMTNAEHKALAEIARALGTIEGVSAAVENAPATALIDAVDTIEHSVKELIACLKQETD